MNGFDKALDILRVQGLCKGRRFDEEGHLCLHGALQLAVGLEHEVKYYPTLAKVAHDLFPDRRDGISSGGSAEYNNHPDTTQEDVELILKHASCEWDLLHSSD